MSHFQVAPQHHCILASNQSMGFDGSLLPGVCSSPGPILRDRGKVVKDLHATASLLPSTQCVIHAGSHQDIEGMLHWPATLSGADSSLTRFSYLKKTRLRLERPRRCHPPGVTFAPSSSRWAICGTSKAAAAYGSHLQQVESSYASSKQCRWEVISVLSLDWVDVVSPPGAAQSFRARDSRYR